jgi:hypothetical protein
MPIQVQGNSGVVAEVDGTVYRAMRTTARPTEYGAFGHYRLSTQVPLVVTQAAASSLFSFRWGDATRFCVLYAIRLQFMQTAAATATIMPFFEVKLALGASFTASDSAGTALTLGGNQFKKRQSMGSTLVTDIRKSAVAAGLTVGTRTLNLEPILELVVNSTITTPNPILYQALAEDHAADGAHPLAVFAQNEGLVVRNGTVAFGAAGTGTLVVDMDWAEVTAY